MGLELSPQAWFLLSNQPPELLQRELGNKIEFFGGKQQTRLPAILPVILGKSWNWPKTRTCSGSSPISSQVSRSAVSVRFASLSSFMPPGKETSPCVSYNHYWRIKKQTLCVRSWVERTVNKNAGTWFWWHNDIRTPARALPICMMMLSYPSILVSLVTADAVRCLRVFSFQTWYW